MVGRDRDVRAEALQLATQAIQAECDRQAADLKYNQNASLPIHSLPQELFIDILLMAVQSPSDRAPYRGILRQTASVAKHWHTTITSCPRFFTIIDQSCSTEAVGTFLRKSGEAPLRIEWQRWKDANVDRFIDNVLPSSPRWRSVRFRCAPTVNLVDKIQQASLVQLEELSLHFTGFHKDTWAMPGLVKYTRWLQKLMLQRVTLDWTTYEAPKLRHLHLKSIRADAPSVADLLAIISTAPRLRVLILDDVSAHAADQLAGEENVRFTTDLEVLHITDVPERTTLALMTTLDMPRLRQLVCTRPPRAVFESHSFSSQVLRPFLMKAPIIKLLVYGRLDGISISTIPEQNGGLIFNKECNPDAEGLCLVSDTRRPMEDLAVLARVVKECDARAPVRLDLIDLRSGHPDFIPTAILDLPMSLFEDLRLVEEVVVGKGVNLPAMLFHLGEVRMDSEGMKVWPWENLSKLSMRCWDGGDEALKEFVDRRWGQARTGSRTPRKLQELELPRGTRKDLLDYAGRCLVLPPV